nr:MAG TPA: hypothetical protein [Caudoviricetes sp.]
MRGYPLTYTGFRVINTIRQRIPVKEPEKERSSRL